jgi:hypothetical protein
MAEALFDIGPGASVIQIEDSEDDEDNPLMLGVLGVNPPYAFSLGPGAKVVQIEDSEEEYQEMVGAISLPSLASSNRSMRRHTSTGRASNLR